MNRIRLFCILAACLALSGCLNLQKPVLEKRYYNIQPQRAQAKGYPLCGSALRLQRLRVSPRFTGRELVYKTESGLYESDFYNAFFIPPADMLTQDLLDWLGKANLFAHVVDPSSLVETDLTLEGAVNSLYGDYSQSPPRAVLEMQFFLLDQNAFGDAILLSKDYSESVALRGHDPKDLVNALQDAARDIFARLEGDLLRYLKEKSGN